MKKTKKQKIVVNGLELTLYYVEVCRFPKPKIARPEPRSNFFNSFRQHIKKRHF